MLVFPIGLFASPASGPPAWVIDSTATFDMDFENGRYYGAQPSDLVSGVLDTSTLIPSMSSGTVYVEFNNPSQPYGNYYQAFCWSDSSLASTPYLSCYCLQGGNGIRSENVAYGASPVAITDISAAGLTTVKMGVAWNSSTFEVAMNGGTPVSKSGFSPVNSVNKLGIGVFPSNLSLYAFPNGRSSTGVRRIAFIPSFVANRTQTLTA